MSSNTPITVVSVAGPPITVVVIPAQIVAVVAAGQGLQGTQGPQGPAGTAVGSVLRYDVAQMLDALQKRQACENIGVGDPEHSFTADYTLAKS